MRSACDCPRRDRQGQERVVLALEGEQAVDPGRHPRPALPLEVVEARAHQHVDLEVTHAG
jgi:hypothetical protein